MHAVACLLPITRRPIKCFKKDHGLLLNRITHVCRTEASICAAKLNVDLFSGRLSHWPDIHHKI